MVSRSLDGCSYRTDLRCRSSSCYLADQAGPSFPGRRLFSGAFSFLQQVWKLQKIIYKEEIYTEKASEGQNEQLEAEKRNTIDLSWKNRSCARRADFQAQPKQEQFLTRSATERIQSSTGIGQGCSAPHLNTLF